MPIRKTRRNRRPAITSFESYKPPWEYLRHVSTLPNDWWSAMLTWHIEAFSTEADARQFYEEHRARFFHQPGERAFLWWLFDAPAAYDENMSEYQQLRAMDELTADEIEALRAKAADVDRERHHPHGHQPEPFRRDELWWAYLAPEPRDPSVFEASQLVRMGVLTILEREILDSPERATGQRGLAILPNRTRYYYLDEGERELLGLAAGHDLDVAETVTPGNSLDENGSGEILTPSTLPGGEVGGPELIIL